MGRTITVATRAGALAIAQTETVISLLKKVHPDLRFDVKKITTEGDSDRRTALWNLEKTGFFTSAVEQAVLRGRANIAVHSFKDLPTDQTDGLMITAVCDRNFAQDCLTAANRIDSIYDLPTGAKIGTSSLRRNVQIKRLRRDINILPIRGNVKTRIRLLDDGKFDAVVLARAGLERLGLGNRVSVCFETENFLPAAAQGALAVQAKCDDDETRQLTAAIDDETTRIECEAERQILIGTGCGCHGPVGVFAKIENNRILIDAFVSDLQGKNYIRRNIRGSKNMAMELAKKLADELLDAGGREILNSLEKK